MRPKAGLLRNSPATGMCILCRVRAIMFTARKKIAKEKGAEPDVFEESVAQVHNSEIVAADSGAFK